MAAPEASATSCRYLRPTTRHYGIAGEPHRRVGGRPTPRLPHRDRAKHPGTPVSCSTGDALMQSNIEQPVVGEQMGTSPTRIPPEYARPHHPARDSRHHPYEQGVGQRALSYGRYLLLDHDNCSLTRKRSKGSNPASVVPDSGCCGIKEKPAAGAAPEGPDAGQGAHQAFRLFDDLLDTTARLSASYSDEQLALLLDLLDRFRTLITEQTTITEHSTTLRTQTASNKRTTPGG
jgi:hypothetical protein